ncbi:hypothetical protein GQ457_14G002010 [Hibiscus cannabinus]
MGWHFKVRRDEEIMWRVPWLGYTKVMYKCVDYDWLMLLDVQTINNSWKHCYFMRVVHDKERMITLDYNFWRHARMNYKLSLSTAGENKSLDEHLKNSRSGEKFGEEILGSARVGIFQKWLRAQT